MPLAGPRSRPPHPGHAHPRPRPHRPRPTQATPTPTPGHAHPRPRPHRHPHVCDFIISSHLLQVGVVVPRDGPAKRDLRTHCPGTTAVCRSQAGAQSWSLPRLRLLFLVALVLWDLPPVSPRPQGQEDTDQLFVVSSTDVSKITFNTNPNEPGGDTRPHS